MPSAMVALETRRIDLLHAIPLAYLLELLCLVLHVILELCCFTLRLLPMNIVAAAQ